MAPLPCGTGTGTSPRLRGVNRATTSSLTVGLVVAVVVVFVIVRRMRPQAVNPTRILLMGGVFIALLLVALGGDFSTFARDVPAIIAAPFALVVGAVLGFAIVRSMTFWTDPESGLLWMRGGVVFAIVYVFTLLLRVGATYLTSAGAHVRALEQLRGVSADLVFLSIGMWAIRAWMIYQRYRQHLAEGGRPFVTTRPR